jgi:hypothetical protein
MGKLHQMVSFKGLAHSAALLRNKLGMPFSLAKLILLFAVSMSLSVSAMAQSADAAISAARQWLTLADADQAGQMWEQSAALMKGQSDRKTWIGYIGGMRSQLGHAPDVRFWQAMEHQINHPDLPRGEFASVTFVSDYAKARAWEKVALVWQDEHWVPVGYQYGAIPAIPK